MARGVNKVILVGNLGNDPETKFTQSGTAVTSVSLATSSVWNNKEGEKQERTDWHRVVFFGKLGEIAGEYLHKGSQVYVEGEIRYDKYTDKDGNERYSTQIICDEMQMLGAKPDGERRAAPTRQESAPRREAAPAKSNDFADDFADDDIPF